MIMDEFLLVVMPVNGAYQSPLSKDIVTERPDSLSGVRVRIMDGAIFYVLWVILIATGTPVKCCSQKSLPFFVAF